jgi:hypothetical protein
MTTDPTTTDPTTTDPTATDPTATDPIRTGSLRRPLLAGAWLLPVFTALLTLGTLTHQPDPGSDFPGYADYVTTPVFLVSHLGASIVGAAVGIVGTVAVALLVAVPSGHPGRTLTGAALAVLGNVLNTALFGVAAFAQPAIGRAFRSDAGDAVALNGDVYGPALFATAGAALLAWTAGLVLLGAALRRADPRLRLAGPALAALVVVFWVSGLPGGFVQPVLGAVATVAAVVVVRRLRRVPGPVPAEAVAA